MHKNVRNNAVYTYDQQLTGLELPFRLAQCALVLYTVFKLLSRFLLFYCNEIRKGELVYITKNYEKKLNICYVCMYILLLYCIKMFPYTYEFNLRKIIPRNEHIVLNRN